MFIKIKNYSRKYESSESIPQDEVKFTYVNSEHIVYFYEYGEAYGCRIQCSNGGLVHTAHEAAEVAAMLDASAERVEP